MIARIRMDESNEVGVVCGINLLVELNEKNVGVLTWWEALRSLSTGSIY